MQLYEIHRKRYREEEEKEEEERDAVAQSEKRRSHGRAKDRSDEFPVFRTAPTCVIQPTPWTKIIDQQSSYYFEFLANYTQMRGDRESHLTSW
jgi:hypothetical protein